MGVIITKDDILAYAEVDYIIHHMNEKYLEMLPPKLVTFFSQMKDPDYEVYVDPRRPLQSQNLKKYTLEIIALLHLKYWCIDEERKKELYKRMEMNQANFEERLKEKFNTDNIFDNNVVAEPKEDLSKPKKLQILTNKKEEKPAQTLEKNDETNNNEIVKKENENIFKKIISSIKGLFVSKK